jgi:hypothetical protein
MCYWWGWSNRNTRLVFERCSVRISARTSAILTEVSRRFPQSLRACAGIVPQTRLISSYRIHRSPYHSTLRSLWHTCNAVKLATKTYSLSMCRPCLGTVELIKMFRPKFISVSKYHAVRKCVRNFGARWRLVVSSGRKFHRYPLAEMTKELLWTW